MIKLHHVTSKENHNYWLICTVPKFKPQISRAIETKGCELLSMNKMFYGISIENKGSKNCLAAKHEEMNSKKGEVMDCNNAISVIN